MGDMKLLNGSELAGYIKERQAKQVRALRQSWRVLPKLAIISDSENPVNELYLKLKQQTSIAAILLYLLRIKMQ